MVAQDFLFNNSDLGNYSDIIQWVKGEELQQRGNTTKEMVSESISGLYYPFQF